MSDCPETELRFTVPTASMARLVAGLSGTAARTEHGNLRVLQLDSPGRHVAAAGLVWTLRHEGRRWVQNLAGPGRHRHERLAHAAIRPDATWDEAAHAGSVPGARLQSALRAMHQDHQAIAPVCRALLRRTTRRVRGRAAVVDVHLDDGRLLAEPDGTRQRVRELSFTLVSGTPAAMAALAERWCRRFDLAYEPRPLEERGDQLCRGLAGPALRKSALPVYQRGAPVQTAFGAVLDECLDQVVRNAAGLHAGQAVLAVEHVHQLRVGVRRLRSALRSFEGWVPAPPPALVEALRALFGQLGQARDQDVLASGVAAELAAAGAPPIALPAPAASVDPAALVRSAATQQLFLGWIGWRLTLLDGETGVAKDAAADTGAPADDTAPAAPVDAAMATAPPPGLAALATARLQRWHRRIVADGRRFETLDEAAVHALRKRIKRQRYALEFFAPLLRRREMARYLRALSGVQDQMGLLNDLFVARASYQAQVDAEPAAWFALGWTTARIAALRTATLPALRRLADTPPPRPRRAA